jgi:nicotinamidase-related amidase
VKAALLVIDMLADFVRPGGALYIGPVAEQVMLHVAGEIARARTEENMVIYLCDSHRPDDAEFTMFPVHCLQGTPGSLVVAELAPASGDIVIPKQRYSGFFGTELDTILRENGIEELRLVGVCTNICVLYTAADARMRGYRVIVPADAVASFSPTAHDWALEEMDKTLGCEVRRRAG